MALYEITIEAESESAVRRALLRAWDSFQEHEDDSAPYRITIHCDETPEGDYDLSGPDEPRVSAFSEHLDTRKGTPLSDVGETQFYGDGWIKHDGGECPVHPLDVLDIRLPSESVWPPAVAKDLIWPTNIIAYRHHCDEDGIPYVADDGTLEDWAEYIVTGPRGGAAQHEAKPLNDPLRWKRPNCHSMSAYAPNRYVNTHVPWDESLRRVWRPE